MGRPELTIRIEGGQIDISGPGAELVDVRLDHPGHTGALLRCWRRHRGLTQADLAEMVGITTGAICHLEVGRNRLSESMRQRLAGALGIDPEALGVTDAP